MVGAVRARGGGTRHVGQGGRGEVTVIRDEHGLHAADREVSSRPRGVGVRGEVGIEDGTVGGLGAVHGRDEIARGRDGMKCYVCQKGKGCAHGAPIARPEAPPPMMSTKTAAAVVVAGLPWAPFNGAPGSVAFMKSALALGVSRPDWRTLPLFEDGPERRA